MFTKKLLLLFITCSGSNLIQTMDEINPRSGSSDVFYNKNERLKRLKKTKKWEVTQISPNSITYRVETQFINEPMSDQELLDNQARILKQYLKYFAQQKTTKNK